MIFNMITQEEKEPLNVSTAEIEAIMNKEMKDGKISEILVGTRRG